MGIDVTITQKLFGSKCMPLEVILGENLHFGNFVSDKLNIGELGETEFVAYNPKSIGRGFSVVWNPKEKKTIELRLPQPSTTQELSDFYAAVERMARHWNARLDVDGRRVSIEGFKTGFQNMVEFNDSTIKHISQQILDGERDTLTLHSAMWPLVVGKEEATLFWENPDSFSTWLHEKQAMDVYFASPCFFAGEAGVFARYFLTNDLPTVFPNQPSVPYGAVALATGEPLECTKWKIVFGIKGETEPLCEMDYFQFLKIVSNKKKTKYDGNHFVLSAMTKEEIKMLSAQ